jgi:diguanylate cyclase (GGDEF)-like protein/PAS domain S-box-containing protein
MPGPLPAKRLACATIGPPIASTVADSPAPHAARDGRLVMHNLTSLSLRPARWRVLRLIWPFVAIVLLLLALGTASLQVIRGVRAYISAESVWSNAQKAAVEALEQYAQTRNEDYFDRYLEESAVQAGARTARVELDKPFPDFATARRGLLAARNHPADIAGMIDLFRRFRPMGFMADGVRLWTQSDALYARIDAAARAMHAAVQGGSGSPADLQPWLVEIRAVDRELTPVERAFSGTFAEASRQVERVLTFATLAIALALVAMAALRTQRLVRKEDAFHTALRASQQRYDYAISGTNDGIFDWSLANHELYLSPRFEQLLGHAPGTLHESAGSFLRRVHRDERRHALALLKQHLANGDPFDLEFRLRMADGSHRWFRFRGRSVIGERGKPQRMAGSLADVSDRRRAEAQTLEQKERAQVTLASIADAVITVDTSGAVEYMNPVAERLTGWRDDEAHGARLPSIFSVLDEATGIEVPDPVARSFVDGSTVHSDGNVVLRRRHDSPIAIDYSAAPIRNNARTIVGAVLVFHDMSRERQYATRLAHLASHDALTGLLNRREFERRVTMALVESQYEAHNHAVLYVDLDEFKVVNDTCGHAAGDELLRQVSALLRPRLREGDTLARLGGDEFGVLLEHCAPDPAFAIADALRTTIGDFHFQWNQRSFKIGASVGVVNVAGGPQTLAGVLSAADAACYMAKDKGRNRVQMYTPESDEVTLRKGEMEWVNRIHRALAENRFCLYAQPVQRTRGDDVSPPYTELLLRLRGDEGELIPPTSFIPAAERYHLMPAIDRWVISSAFALLARQFDAGGAPEGVFAINVSGASIGDDDFLDFVQAQFVRYAVPHASICFEITETTAVASLSKATEFMRALRGLGCRFALDDFGVGVSSFTYLKHLPVDYLKIDGSFVKDMLLDPVNHAMVEAIHRIGHIMGKKTIAESVENRDALKALRAIGVDYAQGFAIAVPAPFGPLRAVYKAQRRQAAGAA